MTLNIWTIGTTLITGFGFGVFFTIASIALMIWAEDRKKTAAKSERPFNVVDTQPSDISHHRH